MTHRTAAAPQPASALQATVDERADDYLSAQVFVEKPSDERLDLVIDKIKDLANTGRISPEVARMRISSLLFRHGVCAEVLRHYPVPAAIYDEVYSAVIGVLTAKVIDPTASGALDLAAPGSTLGWARKVALFAARQKTRDAHRSDDRNSGKISVDALIGVNEPVAEEEAVEGECAVIDLRNDIADAATIAMKTVRGLTRIRKGAAHARDMFKVPAALRPATFAEREEVLTALDKDEYLAHRSLAAFMDVVHGRDPEQASLASKIDSVFLQLWDDYDFDACDRILEVSPQVAHLLAMDAASPWPRPSKRDIQSFRTALARTKTGDYKWRALTAALAAAFVDTEFHYVADYAVVSVDTRDALRLGSAASRSQFEELVARAASYDDFPLGSTPALVRRSLWHLGAETLHSADVKAWASAQYPMPTATALAAV